MKRPTNSARTNSMRQGAILVCVLVCMGIAITIVLASVRSSLQVRRQMRREIQLEQTRWLLEAGMNRAASQLRQQSEYEGETWLVDPALTAYTGAIIEIAVTGDDVPENNVRLQVTARIPAQDPASKPTQRSETVIVPISKTDSDN